ncbi:MAG TPA: polyphosphate polymerase domain-containing protein [Ignavibacteriaceae bacterium]|nr:polyphosphate polymerase domain-containing protein [Ignavibacteriaceae bacterium]
MRIEHKYYLSESDIYNFKKEMMPFVKYDTFALAHEDRNYTVRSVYYDSDSMQFYHEKIDGLKVRKKLRIRGYNDFHGEKVVYIEIKRKSDCYVWKNRAPLLFSDISKFFNGDSIEDLILTADKNSYAITDAKKFLYHYFKDQLHPTALISYEREAMFGAMNDRLRITIDKNLRYLISPVISDLFNEAKLQYVFNGTFILEIKSDYGYPVWLRDLLSRHQLRRSAISKYTLSLDKQTNRNPFERILCSL